MKREDAQVTDVVTIAPKGRVTARTYDVETLQAVCPLWPQLSDEDKHKTLQYLGDDYASDIIETDNLPVDGLLEFIPIALNPTRDADATTSHLALGTGTDAPVASNDELTSEVYRTAVGDAQAAGADLITSTFISQTEANGHVLTEVGLAGGAQQSARLLTHALFEAGDDIDKNSGMVANIDYVLEFRGGAT